MSQEHLEPARSIIGKIGVDIVAQRTKTHVSQVYRWMYSKPRGGTGGLIPMRHIPALIAEAKERGIALSADDFIPKEAAE